jgi:hypothetical protein
MMSPITEPFSSSRTCHRAAGADARPRRLSVEGGLERRDRRAARACRRVGGAARRRDPEGVRDPLRKRDAPLGRSSARDGRSRRARDARGRARRLCLAPFHPGLRRADALANWPDETARVASTATSSSTSRRTRRRWAAARSTSPTWSTSSALLRHPPRQGVHPEQLPSRVGVREYYGGAGPTSTSVACGPSRAKNGGLIRRCGRSTGSASPARCSVGTPRRPSRATLVDPCERVKLRPQAAAGPHGRSQGVP